MRISDWSSDVCSSDLGTVSATSWMAGFNPLVTILDLPYFIPADPDQAQALRTGPFGDRLLETFSEKGFAAVGFWPFGFKQIKSNKPLDSIDAIEGQRFRVMASDILMAQFEALDRKSKRLKTVHNAHLVCRLLVGKKKRM